MNDNEKKKYLRIDSSIVCLVLPPTTQILIKMKNTNLVSLVRTIHVQTEVINSTFCLNI